MLKVIWSTPDGEFDALLHPMPEFALSNVLKSKIYSEEGNIVKGIEEMK